MEILKNKINEEIQRLDNAKKSLDWDIKDSIKKIESRKEHGRRYWYSKTVRKFVKKQIKWFNKLIKMKKKEWLIAHYQKEAYQEVLDKMEVLYGKDN